MRKILARKKQKLKPKLLQAWTRLDSTRPVDLEWKLFKSDEDCWCLVSCLISILIDWRYVSAIVCCWCWDWAAVTAADCHSGPSRWCGLLAELNVGSDEWARSSARLLVTRGRNVYSNRSTSSRAEWEICSRCKCWTRRRSWGRSRSLGSRRRQWLVRSKVVRVNFQSHLSESKVFWRTYLPILVWWGSSRLSGRFLGSPMIRRAWWKCTL